MKRLLQIAAGFFALTSVAFAALNVNTATEAQLEALKNIGPAKAKAIVAYRAKHGQFKTLEDLQKVPGIGPLTAQSIKKEVTFSGGVTAPATTSAAPVTSKPSVPAASMAKSPSPAAQPSHKN